MLRALLWKPAVRQCTVEAAFCQFSFWRGMHSRNKRAMEFIAKGFSALQEVDRVIDYCELYDKRLIPYLKTAKEQFELALEADNSSTHARYWLAKLHLKYHHFPGANKAIGAALLVEAAEMGDPEAQYELGCRLRAENPYVQSDQQAFYYLEKAVDQLHPGALYLLGAVYLTGDCVNQDVSSAIWCFHKASEKGHAGAAVAYGSLLLRAQFRVSAHPQLFSGYATGFAGTRSVDIRIPLVTVWRISCVVTQSKAAQDPDSLRNSPRFTSSTKI